MGHTGGGCIKITKNRIFFDGVVPGSTIYIMIDIFSSYLRIFLSLLPFERISTTMKDKGGNKFNPAWGSFNIMNFMIIEIPKKVIR